jgi:hypothetical protein
MKVVVHIEELVLHGFPPGGRYRVADALQRELGRLLGADLPATLRAPSARDRVVADAPGLEGGSAPEAVGTQVAAAVHGGLSR